MKKSLFFAVTAVLLVFPLAACGEKKTGIDDAGSEGSSELTEQNPLEGETSEKERSDMKQNKRYQVPCSQLIGKKRTPRKDFAGRPGFISERRSR